jgi:hypothetical protein
MATEAVSKPLPFHHAEIVKRGDGRMLAQRGVGIEAGTHIRYYYTAYNRVQGPVTIEIYAITSRNPTLPVLGYEVLPNGTTNSAKTFKIGLAFLRKAAEEKTYEQAFRDYYSDFHAWREQLHRARVAVAAPSGGSGGAVAEAAPPPSGGSGGVVAEAAPPTSDADVMTAVAAARKRAREAFIDALTHDLTTEEAEELLARKRRANQF